jgi:hypothetical protein
VGQNHSPAQPAQLLKQQHCQETNLASNPQPTPLLSEPKKNFSPPPAAAQPPPACRDATSPTPARCSRRRCLTSPRCRRYPTPPTILLVVSPHLHFVPASATAYPNLLGTKTLDHCCCFLRHQLKLLLCHQTMYQNGGKKKSYELIP